MASSSRSPSRVEGIQPYRMHVSQKYLDLTKQKLELTRFPREPQGQSVGQQQGNAGVSKSDLEPLIDHWSENYNWREQEHHFNDTLPQFRAAINGVRLHFVHRRSDFSNAIPLLFIHGFPESFITVTQTIDALCNPIATPPRGDENVPAFHLVAPSIPGFGFSDAVAEEGNTLPTTADVFHALMQTLGYRQYMVHGSGWGFKICRMLALRHSGSCIAIHTVNPEVPAPRFGQSTLCWLKYRVAQLTVGILRRSAFGYTSDDIALSGMMAQQTGLTPPLTPGSYVQPAGRPQTTAYALCDSPPGLLAYILDAIQPPAFTRPSQSPQSTHSMGPPLARLSPTTSGSSSSPRPVGTPASGRSPQTHRMLELTDIRNPWTPTTLLNWTMLYWLPGPEVALRWLVNSAAVEPALWQSRSDVPLGITHFMDTTAPSTGTGQTPPQWAEAYHRVAMVRRREGRVRFPAWERPAEVVVDIRELALLLEVASTAGDMVTNIPVR